MTSSSELRSSDIEFRLSQNRVLYDRLESAENERDNATVLVKEWTKKLSVLHQGLEQARLKLDRSQSDAHTTAKEFEMKTDHVRLLAEQNAGHLTVLEQYESAKSASIARNTNTSDQIEKLKVQEAQGSSIRSICSEKVKTAENSLREVRELLNQAKQETAQLRIEYTNTEAQTSLDVDAMEQALSVMRSRNLEYVQTVARQEERVSNFQVHFANETRTLESLVSKRAGLADLASSGISAREEFGKTRASLLIELEKETNSYQTAKTQLSEVEREREKLANDRREQDALIRDSAEKTYSLMDSIRAVEVEDRKQGVENGGIEKKLRNLEKTVQNISAKIQLEKDAKEAADKLVSEMFVEGDVLKKKSRKAEEAIAISQRAIERRSKEQSNLAIMNNQLWHQNSVLTSRMEGMEEERNGISADLKLRSEKCLATSKEVAALRDEVVNTEVTHRNAQGILKDLEEQYRFVHRMLSESGTQLPPIQIASSESTLLAKLQINEFLANVQRHRQPIPILIDKIASLLAQLHADQINADSSLGALARSNTLVSNYRSLNVSLLERKSELVSLKSNGVVRYVMNLLEGYGSLSTSTVPPSGSVEICLDKLGMEEKELLEVLAVIKQFAATDRIGSLSLSGNCLSNQSLSAVLQFIFACSYLRKIDLRGNGFTADLGRAFEVQLAAMDGVTAVGVIGSLNCETPWSGLVYEAKSGSQIRLTVDLREQRVLVPAIPLQISMLEGNVPAADDHLRSAAGVVDLTNANPLAKRKSSISKVPARTQSMSAPALKSSSSSTPKSTPKSSARVVPVGLGGPSNRFVKASPSSSGSSRSEAVKRKV